MKTEKANFIIELYERMQIIDEATRGISAKQIANERGQTFAKTNNKNKIEKLQGKKRSKTERRNCSRFVSALASSFSNRAIQSLQWVQ